MGKRLEQSLLQGGHTEGPETFEKMVSIDADPGQQDPLLLLYSNTHTHGLQKSCGEKGAV